MNQNKPEKRLKKKKSISILVVCFMLLSIFSSAAALASEAGAEETLDISQDVFVTEGYSSDEASDEATDEATGAEDESGEYADDAYGNDEVSQEDDESGEYADYEYELLPMATNETIVALSGGGGFNGSSESDPFAVGNWTALMNALQEIQIAYDNDDSYDYAYIRLGGQIANFDANWITTVNREINPPIPVTLVVDNARRHFVVESGTVTIGENVTISRQFGTSRTDSGGIQVNANGTLILNGGAIINNSFNAGGGGVNVTGGTLTMNGGTISSNTSSANGGGVLISGGGTFTANGGEISGNTVTGTNGAGMGGGIWVTDANSEITLSNTTISGNTARTSGGGVRASMNAVVTLLNGNTIAGNHALGLSAATSQGAGGNGGGISIFSSTLNIHNNNVITGNTAATNGGGISLLRNADGGTPSEMHTHGTITNVVISSNEAVTGSGGGIVADGQSIIDVCSVTITANDANHSGGGVHMTNGTIAHIRNSSITNNDAVQSGGGLSVTANNSGLALLNPVISFLTVENSTITGNTSTYRGGGILVGRFGTLTLNGSNSLISNNTSNFGGGIFVREHAPRMMNTSGNPPHTQGAVINAGEIVSNHARHDGGGIFVQRHQYWVRNLTEEIAYSNVTVNASVVFNGNTAGNGFFVPPQNAAAFTNIAGTGVSPNFARINHQLNNYDVNFRSLDFIFIKTNAAGSPLAGAEFTLFDASGEVVETVTSGADGLVVFQYLEANSTYRLVETAAPTGFVRPTGYWIIEVGDYGLLNQPTTADPMPYIYATPANIITVTRHGDAPNFGVDANGNRTLLNTASGGGNGGSNGGGNGGTPPPGDDQMTKTPDRTTVRVGETINWTIRGFHNPTGDTVANFTIVDMPGQGLNFQSGRLPAFTNGAGITYEIRYTVAGSNEWHVHATGIDASRSFEFSLPQPGDLHYTSIGFFFGTVPADFGRNNEIVLTFVVGADAPNNELINRFIIRYGTIEIDRESPNRPTVLPPGVYIELDDEDTPLGEWVWDDDDGTWIFIQDQPVPLAASDAPQTGISGIGLYLLMMAASITGFAVLVRSRKRKVKA